MYSKRILLITIIGLAFAATSTSQSGKKPLTNGDIVSMLEAGLAESTIVLAVQQSPSSFDTSPPALIQLKNKGATQRVLDAMLNPTGKVIAPAVSEPLVSKPRLKVDYKLFTFELVDCRLFGSRITCELLATNNDQDKRLEVYGNHYTEGYTRAIDASGNELKASKLQLGTSTSPNVVNATLVKGVPIKLTIVFDDVPQNTTTLSLLDIYVDYQGRDFNDPSQSAQFRDVSVTVATPPTDAKNPLVFKNEFSFEFISCKKAAKLLTCAILIRNNEASEKKIGLKLGGKSAWMVDSDGLEYVPVESGIGENIIRPQSIVGPWVSKAILAPGGTTRITLTYDNTPNPQSIKLLRFSVGYTSSSGGIGDLFNVEFRDLPIQSN